MRYVTHFPNTEICVESSAANAGGTFVERQSIEKSEFGTVEYRELYPTWILVGMDVLAAGILVASFRDAWSVVKSLGADAESLANSIVAAAVVLAIDATILLLEQVRSNVKIRGGNTTLSDVWVLVLILVSAILNVRYLMQTANLLDQSIGVLLGATIPSTIAVLGYIKGDMLAYNARMRQQSAVSRQEAPLIVPRSQTPFVAGTVAGTAPQEQPQVSPMFRLKRKQPSQAA
jgi:hypothetical protein